MRRRRLKASLAVTYQMPVPLPPPPSCDNEQFHQAMTNVPWAVTLSQLRAIALALQQGEPSCTAHRHTNTGRSGRAQALQSAQERCVGVEARPPSNTDLSGLRNRLFLKR